MDRNAQVTKTAKGEEELQQRSHGLERNLRYVLILVDGKSTVQEIIDGKGAAYPDVEASLQQLFDQGYVAVGGVCASGDAACVVSSRRDVSGIKADLIAIAKEVLGSEAGKVVAKLEAAPDSREGLQEVVNSCKKVVKLLIDEEKAEALMRRCSGVLQDL